MLALDIHISIAILGQLAGGRTAQAQVKGYGLGHLCETAERLGLGPLICGVQNGCGSCRQSLLEEAAWRRKPETLVRPAHCFEEGMFTAISPVCQACPDHLDCAINSGVKRMPRVFFDASRVEMLVKTP